MSFFFFQSKKCTLATTSQAYTGFYTCKAAHPPVVQSSSHKVRAFFFSAGLGGRRDTKAPSTDVGQASGAARFPMYTGCAEEAVAKKQNKSNEMAMAF